MNKSVKIFLIVCCCIAAAGLVCVGAGVILGGDFAGIWSNIMTDLHGRLQGLPFDVPFIQ